MNDSIYNFSMPKNLYRDLTSQATLHHQPIIEEIRARLRTTFIPSYRV